MCYYLLGNRMTAQGIVIGLQTAPGIGWVCPQVLHPIPPYLVGGDWNYGILMVNDWLVMVNNG